jgi:capsular exopolysaccharide synthesis family protein
MERIKQALDKARAERIADGAVESKSDEFNTNSRAGAEGLLGNAAIRYSQTEVQGIDLDLLRSNRVIIGDADKVGATAYKMLRTQVLQRMTANGWNALAITSPGPEEGKSLTAVNLAISLARELHHTVLLVDIDLRNPSIHKIFGIQPKAGISDYLLRGASMEDILINPGIERLVILPGTESIENSSEILASPTMGNLVQELKNRYPSRMVIFDLPPVLLADDALSFMPFVDAFLLVLRDGKTTQAALQQTMELMKNAKIIGTLLNDSSERISSYY